jgi:hypothetical protein
MPRDYPLKPLPVSAILSHNVYTPALTGRINGAMIDWLRTTTTAYFYKKRKRLPKIAIGDLFRTIRNSSDAVGRNVFNHIKEQYSHSQWSAIAFFYERDPSFLAYPEGYDHTKERICGFLLLIECREYAVLFKSNLELPSTFKTEYLQRVGDQHFEAAVAPVDATFEKLTLRSMTSSKHTLRSKTLEAKNLQNLIGRAGSSRFIAQGYRSRQNGQHLSATPNTGRLSMRSDRLPYKELITWAESSIEKLGDDAPVLSPFIESFTRPINLASMPANLSPTYIAVDVPQLTEDIFEAPEEIRLVRKRGDAVVPLDKNEAELVLAVLDQSFVVQSARGDFAIIDPRNNTSLGNIALNKNRISLRRFTLAELDDICVEMVNAPTQEGPCIPLKRHIDHNNLFSILFNDPAVVYVSGTLYRDNNLTDGRSFLSHIRSCASLNTVTDEKGAFARGQAAFDVDSAFGVIVNHIADRELLVCDDLGDEWADFVGVNDESLPKTLSFYHAKHSEPTLGASALHVVVSQAIKNLGRLNASDDEITSKLDKWQSLYRNDNEETAIQRVIGSTARQLQAKLTNVLLSPDTIRRVFIVTTSLSRRQLEQQFEDIRGGNGASAHFVQLYWLLMSFFSACIEVNASGYVVCRE